MDPPVPRTDITSFVIPNAVTIRSGPAPSREAHFAVEEWDGESESGPSVAGPSRPQTQVQIRGQGWHSPLVSQNEAFYTQPHPSTAAAATGTSIATPASVAPAQPFGPSLPYHLPKHIEWRDWNINPTHHGPERLKHPPAFVKAVGVYDELGRGVGDGVEVEVSRGREGGGEEKKKGEDVRDWYLSLAVNTKAKEAGKGKGEDKEMAEQGEGTSSKTKVAPARADNSGEVIATDPPSRRLPGQPEIIDVDALPSPPPAPPKPLPRRRRATAVAQPSQKGPANPQRPPPTSAPDPAPAPTQSDPLRIDRREWFIRRALLTQSSTPDTSPNPTPPPRHRSSISSLLSIPSTSKPRTMLPNYALGPENKGYEILKEKLGWEGGGLGRPEGWEEAGGTEIGEAACEAESGSRCAKGKRKQQAEDASAKEQEVTELDTNGNTVVDLTLSSPSYSPSPSRSPSPGPSGPGRTVPISTTLKLDRLGLGHRHARERAHLESTKKKVTHSHKEIVEAQKRARFGQGKAGSWVGGSGDGEGRKGKVDWKKRDRREREERSKLLAALNA